MNVVNLVINNKSISVATGTTVLAAARLTGIYIPTLCSHPNLPPAPLEIPISYIFLGGKKVKNIEPNKRAQRCGLCIVEIEGKKDLLSSCTALVKENMVVFTDTDKVIQERKKSLIPIISRHRHTCLTCAQQEGCGQTQCSSNVPENERCCSNFNNCELRKITNFIGISDSTPKWVSSSIPVIKNEPLFKIDYNLCIGCTRCIRVCNKVREVGAIGFVWDNQKTLRVGTVSESLTESECKFCTACVEVCPTGALQDDCVRIGTREEDIVPCIRACPVHINIPEYLRMISLNKFETAYEIIREKLPFPSILGRICMHPCEEVCRRGKINNPVSICALKKFTADIIQNNTFRKKTFEINTKTNKKISIVGAGPTGLAAAFYLRKKGHSVILYDENDKAGGMLRYGIPHYRLPPQILDKEIEVILSMGVKFKSNKKLGKNLDLNYLKQDGSDAILLAVGAKYDRKINLDGCNLNGVSGGISFLRKVSENYDIEIGQNVVVVGGGNVAIDVAMTAIRCGAKKVSIVCLETEEEMPANAWEIRRAKNEGITILPSWAARKIVGDNDHVIGLELIKCTSVFNSTGTFNPVCNDKIKQNIIADQIIIAVGQETDTDFLNSIGISTKKGLIIVDEDTLETTSKNIYSGGDVITIKRSVINAIASGQKAAKSINNFLEGDDRPGPDNPINVKLQIDRPLNTGYIGRDEGFVKWSRETETEIDPKNCFKNFNEIVIGFNKKQATQEASRCLQCDLRLKLDHNPPPPQFFLPLNIETLNAVVPNETEGVYKLFDNTQTVIAITGTSTVRHELIQAIRNNTSATSFQFEEDKMYSKRESELIQKHLQEYGEMPGKSDDIDDLF